MQIDADSRAELEVGSLTVPLIVKEDWANVEDKTKHTHTNNSEIFISL